MISGAKVRSVPPNALTAAGSGVHERSEHMLEERRMAIPEENPEIEQAPPEPPRKPVRANTELLKRLEHTSKPAESDKVGDEVRD